MGLFNIFKKKKPTETAETEVDPAQKETAAASNSEPDSSTVNTEKASGKKPNDEQEAPASQPAEVSDSSDATTGELSEKQQPAEPTAASTTSTSEQESTPATAAEQQQDYNQGLEKTRHSFRDKFNAFMANFRSVDEDFFDDLEDLLIQSDVGYNMALKISDALRAEVRLQNAKSKKEVSQVIVNKMAELYQQDAQGHNFQLNLDKDRLLNVILFVGVNGAGKTTTIGKLAAQFKAQGQKVLLAAGDTFRAGAIEQLQAWGQQVGVETVAGSEGSDPAAVVYEALQKAQQQQFDVLLVDTAGRLQNNTNLMKELEKIKRIITKQIPDAPHEVLLVIDATTGQNALSQAKQFEKVTQVTGIVLTKLDGSAQGGIVLAINDELHIPVKLVGLGEQVQDLQIFDPQKFATGLFSDLLVDE